MFDELLTVILNMEFSLSSRTAGNARRVPEPGETRPKRICYIGIDLITGVGGGVCSEKSGLPPSRQCHSGGVF